MTDHWIAMAVALAFGLLAGVELALACGRDAQPPALGSEGRPARTMLLTGLGVLALTQLAQLHHGHPTASWVKLAAAAQLFLLAGGAGWLALIARRTK